MAINQGMRRQVEEKVGILRSFLAALEAKAERYRTVAGELGMELPPGWPGSPQSSGPSGATEPAGPSDPPASPGAVQKHLDTPSPATAKAR
jgi:hypothetical protein